MKINEKDSLFFYIKIYKLDAGVYKTGQDI